jgi:hypothetical protein
VIVTAWQVPGSGAAWLPIGSLIRSPTSISAVTLWSIPCYVDLHGKVGQFALSKRQQHVFRFGPEIRGVSIITCFITRCVLIVAIAVTLLQANESVLAVTTAESIRV